MAIEQELRGSLLSANELHDITMWPPALIEDYLNIFDNLILVAGGTDQNNEDIQTIEQRVDALEEFTEDNQQLIENLRVYINKLKSELRINDSKTADIEQYQYAW